jgi:hypothetical protein
VTMTLHKAIFGACLSAAGDKAELLCLSFADVKCLHSRGPNWKQTWSE